MIGSDKAWLIYVALIMGAVLIGSSVDSCSNAARYRDCVKYHAPKDCK